VDSFEYLIALVSVIAGLGITRALSGLARVLNARREISISWIPICWTMSVLLWLVAFWWFTFLLSSFEAWTPGLHIFVLIYAGAIFFLLALLHPESIEPGHNMLAHLLNNRRVFFGTLLIVGLIDIADTWIKFQLDLSTPPLMKYLVHMAVWIAVSVIAMIVHRRTYHALLALIFLVSIVLWQIYSIAGILEIVGGDA
jgi:hypothetical protein